MTPMTRTHLIILLIVGLSIATLLGCETRAPSDTTPVELDEHLRAYVVVLDALSTRLEENESPEKALASLRTYMKKHRVEVDAVTQAAEKHIMSLPDTTRVEYVEKHRGPVLAAMYRFAHAQQAFRKRATDAQNVELTELFNQSNR